jgi:hypothetical protein
MYTQNARMSRSDVSGITYKQLRSPHNVYMEQGHHYQISRAVLATIGVALAAVRFYQVRELLAALLLFSLLFAAVGIGLLILFLIQEAALKGVNCIEARVAYVRAWHSGLSSQPTKDHVLRGSRWN